MESKELTEDQAKEIIGEGLYIEFLNNIIYTIKQSPAYLSNDKYCNNMGMFKLEGNFFIHYETQLTKDPKGDIFQIIKLALCDEVNYHLDEINNLKNFIKESNHGTQMERRGTKDKKP